MSWGYFEVPDPLPAGPGCPPGSIWQTFPAAPSLGALFTTGKCTTLSQGPPPLGPMTSLQYRLNGSSLPEQSV